MVHIYHFIENLIIRALNQFFKNSPSSNKKIKYQSIQLWYLIFWGLKKKTNRKFFVYKAFNFIDFIDFFKSLRIIFLLDFKYRFITYTTISLRFDEKSLRQFNSSLESFRHKDFKYIISEKRPALFNTLDIISNRKETANKEGTTRKPKKKKKKLPIIGETTAFKEPLLLPNKRTNLNVLGLANKNAKQSRKSSLISQKTTNVETGSLTHNFYNLDIDHFLKRKTRELLNSPWHLNTINATLTGVSKTNITRQESTENLITKLKNLFREKYNQSNMSTDSENSTLKSLVNAPSFQYDSSMLSSLSGANKTSLPKNVYKHTRENSNEYYYVNNKSESIYTIGQPTITYNSMAPTPLKIADKNPPSIYLKKLKNNYYDRKLWYSLLLSSNDSKLLNVYAENSCRDYNSEFNILNRTRDSSEFNFSKCKMRLNLFFKSSFLRNSVKKNFVFYFWMP